MTTALVFAGGGSLGAIQVGMLKALAEGDVRADFLVGSSVGAINAAYFAVDPTIRGAEQLELIWRSLRRDDIFHLSWWGGLKGLLGKRSYLFDGETFHRFLASNLPYRQFEETKLPLHIVTSDFISGEEVILSQGAVLPALQASAAIPGVFPAVEIAGRFLMDGGVANHTPVSTAVRLGASRLIVLPTGISCALTKPPDGAVDTALHALNLVIARQLLQDLEAYQDQAEIFVIPPLCPQRTHPLDFHAAGDLIAQGYEMTRQWLANDGLQKKGSFAVVMPHRH